MSERIVKVDLGGLDRTEQDLERVKPLVLGRLGELGYQTLRQEIKADAYATGNLYQGVAPPDVDVDKGTATLTVSARSGATGPQAAVVHYPSGKTKAIVLRPQIPFNYAEPVAHGRPAIRPKVGRALIIPVSSVTAGESYISNGTQLFVVRRSAKAFAGTHFDEKAAVNIEAKAADVAGAVFGELFA